jgi:predicted nucleic acid-binding protein
MQVIRHIAEVNNAALATRNVADFENCSILITNPWLD